MRIVWTVIFALILTVAAVGAWWVFVPPEVRTLTVAAGERESDSHTLMEEVAEVLERHSDTIRLKVVESRNGSEAISAINRGVVDLATIESNTPAYTTIALVADLFPDYFLMIARKGPTLEQRYNPLERIPDLRNRRIAIPEAGTVGNLSFWSIIDHYKLPPRSFRTFSLTRAKAAEAFIDGRVDVIFFVSSLRDPFLLRLLENAGLRNIALRFIPVEQAEAMTLKRPYLETASIVKGAFDGRAPLPLEDIPTPSLHRLLVTHANADEEAIHELTRTIFENRLDLLVRMALSSAIRDPRREGTASLPIHPGAVRFYDRDEPTFLQENAEPMALVVTVFAMLLSAFFGFRRNMQSRAKNRGDRYNTQLVEMAHRARDTTDVAELEDMKRELLAILDLVVDALDNDRITEEGFQSFAFLWGSTKDTVNERIRRLE